MRKIIHTSQALRTSSMPGERKKETFSGFRVPPPEYNNTYASMRYQWKIQFYSDMLAAERVPLISNFDRYETIPFARTAEPTLGSEERKKYSPFVYKPNSSFYGIDVLLLWLRETILKPFHILFAYLSTINRKETHDDAKKKAEHVRGLNTGIEHWVANLCLHGKKNIYEHFPHYKIEVKGSWYFLYLDKLIDKRFYGQAFMKGLMGLARFLSLIIWWIAASAFTIAVSLICAQARMLKHLTINLIASPRLAFGLGVMLAIYSIQALYTGNTNAIIQGISNLIGMPQAITTYLVLLLSMALLGCSISQECVSETYVENKKNNAKKYWLRQFLPISMIVGFGSLLLHPGIQEILINQMHIPADLNAILVAAACLITFSISYCYTLRIHDQYNNKCKQSALHSMQMNESSGAKAKPSLVRRALGAFRKGRDRDSARRR
jgi:hypothetical protein